VLPQRVTPRLKTFLSLLLPLVLAACTSVRPTDTWQADCKGPAVKKVFVIGVSTGASLRRTLEDAYVKRLQAAGVAATPSHTMFAGGRKIEEEKLRAALRQSRADGVLITRVIRIDRRDDFDPGFIGPAPPVGYRRSLYDYYAAAWEAPPREISLSYELAVIETNLWSAKTKQLIWSGSTETFGAKDVRIETPEFAAAVIEALRESGLI
jgi:hypothetical protein